MNILSDKQSDPILFKGMTFGYYARNGYFGSRQAREQVDKMAALGIEWLCVVSTVLQETMLSTRQFRDFQVTPADDELRDIIAYGHKKGLKIMLRPMIECWDGTQRYHINFPDDQEIIPGKPICYWQKWFESYAELTRHYCRLATRVGCEAYSCDSELNSTTRKNDHWLRIVELARQEFGGHLTTSMIKTPQFTDQLTNPDHWFFALDSVGSSMYAPAAIAGGATVAEMATALKAYRDAGLDCLIRPDHTPSMAGEDNGSPGYEMQGRLFAVGYMKGLMDALEMAY